MFTPATRQKMATNWTIDATRRPPLPPSAAPFACCPGCVIGRSGPRLAPTIASSSSKSLDFDHASRSRALTCGPSTGTWLGLLGFLKSPPKTKRCGPDVRKSALPTYSKRPPVFLHWPSSASRKEKTSPGRLLIVRPSVMAQMTTFLPPPNAHWPARLRMRKNTTADTMRGTLGLPPETSAAITPTPKNINPTSEYSCQGFDIAATLKRRPACGRSGAPGGRSAPRRCSPSCRSRSAMRFSGSSCSTGKWSHADV